ncbi:F-box protein At5g49610-like [Salvia miltiorrhiza]|uniref:F-box protein At5g49610-like n=1 Tax=Salvia miltiorrhiza TaxID=226208 RepID=UPI0025AC1557|nr:F-box protein At5g49610-like [Salvia miltiorrhiza]
MLRQPLHPVRPASFSLKSRILLQSIHNQISKLKIRILCRNPSLSLNIITNTTANHKHKITSIAAVFLNSLSENDHLPSSPSQKKKKTMETNIELPDDIVTEILMKLPVKSVYKFKCVSKKWLWLTSDASFKSHLIPRAPPLMFIFQLQNFESATSFVCADRNLEKLSSAFPRPPSTGMKVASTANDLILYESEHGHEVANPFTGQRVRLPMGKGKGAAASPKAGLIAYTDEKGAVRSYIVVRIVMRDYDNRHTRIQIFSSDEGRCRWLEPPECEFELDAVRFDCSRVGVLYEGALHWVCNRMSNIFVYDPVAHRCRLIQTPCEVYHVRGMNSVVGTSCGKLYYFESHGICLEVDKSLPSWKLWEYGEGKWRLHASGGEREMEGVVGDLLSTTSAVHPIAMHPHTQHVVIYFWHLGSIFTFDTNKGWFDDNFAIFKPATIISSWEIHPLFLPLCYNRIPAPLK